MFKFPRPILPLGGRKLETSETELGPGRIDCIMTESGKLGDEGKMTSCLKPVRFDGKTLFEDSFFDKLSFDESFGAVSLSC